MKGYVCCSRSDTCRWERIQSKNWIIQHSFKVIWSMYFTTFINLCGPQLAASIIERLNRSLNGWQSQFWTWQQQICIILNSRCGGNGPCWCKFLASQLQLNWRWDSYLWYAILWGYYQIYTVLFHKCSIPEMPQIRVCTHCSLSELFNLQQE
jgi:hypothetical protein